MNTFRFLPHYFKYIGLAIYILFGGAIFLQDFSTGFMAANDKELEYRKFPDFLYHNWMTIVAYVGILIYALSRDRVFDEFILKLRMESIAIVFFGSLLFVMVRLIFDASWEMDAAYLLEAQLIFYLIINKARKSLLAQT